MRRQRVALLLLGGLLAGCFHLSQPSPDIREYRLAYAPPAVAGQKVPVTLRLAPLGVVAMYDRQPIVYGDDAYSGGTFYYARWSTNPSAMLSDLLARDFVDSHLYTAVQQSPSLLANDYQLGGEVEEIQEHMGAAGCAARLRVRVLLVRLPASGNPVVLQSSFAAEEPCACNAPRSLVEAMSTAMAHVSAQLQQAVYEAIAQDRAARAAR